MQSLSVTNLEVFEVEDNEYVSSADNLKTFSTFIKRKDTKDYRNKLKLNLSRLLPRSHQKYNLHDSGYLSGSTSAETVFSIDNNNYISFKLNPELRQQLYSSSQSLYDKSPIDSSEIFGLNFSVFSSAKQNQLNQIYVEKKSSTFPSTVGQKTKNISKNQNLKFENRSWDQILKLSDEVLDEWLSYKRNIRVNTAFNYEKRFEYLEPNLEIKNSLLLNQNLLYQPIRRFTSEINLRKIIFNSSEMFSDDFQMDSHFIPENNLRKLSINSSIPYSLITSSEESELQNSYTEEIYELFMDLHEFRINDDNIEKVAEKICRIEKYLMSRVKASDLAGYMFNKSLCGCGLSSLCSIIQFSQALTKIIVNCIDSKIAVYQRIAYIIAYIKLSMSLYRHSNWQSLNTLVSSLHSLKIYRMNNEWTQIKVNHKHYFDEFIKLSALVNSSEISLMYSIPKGIPSLYMLLLAKKIQCLSKWDRLERPAKWTQHPGIINWLEKELKCSLKSLLHLRDNTKNQEIDDNLSGSLSKQFICLIAINKMPDNWLNRSLRNIPQQYKEAILDHLILSLNNDLKL